MGRRDRMCSILGQRDPAIVVLHVDGRRWDRRHDQQFGRAYRLSSPRYAYCMMCLRFDIDRSGCVRDGSGHEHDIGVERGEKWSEGMWGVTGRAARDEWPGYGSARQ
ncbi:hypothetical protein EMIT0158MI4_20371 [Burkholderia ambifaria]